MQRFEGIPASEGIAIGPAFVYRPRVPSPARRPVADPHVELARLQHALERAKEQLGETHRKAVAAWGAKTAAIFEAHRMFLEDPALLEVVTSQIRAGVNAEAALTEGVTKFETMLTNLRDPSLRERAADLRDVGQRVLRVLAGEAEQTLATLDAPAVIVAAELVPSDTVQMSKALTLSVATARGGRTSHAAILMRARGLPAVVGLGGGMLDAVANGTQVIVDGDAGVVIIDPDAATLADYRSQASHRRALADQAQAAAQAPAVTRDGRRLEVVANVGDVESAGVALNSGAEGVGLLRTEFLFLNRGTMPDEEEQYAAYRAIAEALGSRPLIFRTLDVGGDKPPPYLDFGRELNPCLGWRAIRVSLAHPAMLVTQLRAILRAGAGYNVKVMFPLITTVDELRAARRLLQEARTELLTRGVEFAEAIEVGIMIEVPAAALIADILAREVDFFSLGTNDLIQYALAVDRTSERVGYLYDPLHPAILRLVKTVIDSGHWAGRWVGMCGEMAGDLDAVPLLLGLGLDEFSVNPPAIPQVKMLIRNLDAGAMQTLAAQALELSSGAEIRALVRKAVPRV